MERRKSTIGLTPHSIPQNRNGVIIERQIRIHGTFNSVAFTSNPNTTSNTPEPDPGVVLDLLQAFRWSKTMFTAVSLGVFDALTAAPKPLRALADELRANPDALERLLDACVGLQLLDREGQNYKNTPVASTYLCSSSPHRLTGYVSYS